MLNRFSDRRGGVAPQGLANDPIAIPAAQLIAIAFGHKRTVCEDALCVYALENIVHKLRVLGAIRARGMEVFTKPYTFVCIKNS